MSNKLKLFKMKIPCKNFVTSGGTFTAVAGTGIPYLSKTAANTTSMIAIPIPILQGHESGQGVKLKSVEIPIRLATANADSAPTVTLYRQNMLAVAGASADITASALTTTLTGATVTADANDRLLTCTVDSPALDYDTEDKAGYVANLRINAGTSTALRVYDAIAYFEVPV